MLRVPVGWCWFLLPLWAALSFPGMFVSAGRAADFGVSLWAYGLGGVALFRMWRRGREASISLSEAVLFLGIVVAWGVDSFHGPYSPVVWWEAGAWWVAFVVLRRMFTQTPDCMDAVAAGCLAVFLLEWGWAVCQVVGIASVDVGFRATGSFDNPAGLAVASLAAWPGGWWVRKRFPAHAGKALVVGLVMVVWLLWIAGSRAGFVAWGAVAVVGFVGNGRGWRVGHCVSGTVIGVVAVGLLCFLKPASTAGRWTIVRCTAGLVADSPWMGHGTAGFTREYMPRQAEWLTRQGSPQEKLLAGQVQHPLNEYLGLAVAFGVPLTLAVVAFGIWALTRKGDAVGVGRWPVALLAGLALLALFSYPLHYALGRVLLVVALAAIFSHDRWVFRVTSRRWCRNAACGTALVVLGGAFLATSLTLYGEACWNRLARRSLAGETVRVLPGYEALLSCMSSNAGFLYNYAAELNVAGRYEKSDSVLVLCRRFLNDYDVEMLAADNALAFGQREEAERLLWHAHAMVPARFAPLHVLMTGVYLPAGDTWRARNVAGLMLRKTVKVPSADVDRMLEDARRVWLSVPHGVNGTTWATDEAQRPAPPTDVPPRHNNK